MQNDDDSLSNNQSNSLDDTGLESKGNESSNGLDGGEKPDDITSGIAGALHSKKRHRKKHQGNYVHLILKYAY